MYEEINDALESARIGNVEGMDILLKNLNPLIIKSIKRYYYKPAEFEDLMQEGRIVILECIRDFDESKGIHFLGYVKAMLKYYYLDKHKQKKTLSLNESVGGDGEEELIDLLEADLEDAIDTIIKSDESQLLYNSLSFISKRQREIIIDFYYKNLTISQIAEKYGIAYRTVVNTKTAALNNLKAKLQNI